MPTTEDLEQLYDAQLKNQKSQLTQDYEQALSELDASKQAAQKQLDQNLNTTAVEAQRAQKNYGEVQNAYGLTSGAMAQAKLAQDNQLQADLTALRTAHQTADAETERQRALLGQQYAAAITQAQAENDIAKAQALYEEAKEAETQLLAKQESAAALTAQAGDYSLYQQLYGLTDEQTAALSTLFQQEQQKQTDQEARSQLEAAAALMAQAGDFTLYQQLYGLTDEQTAALTAKYKAETTASSTNATAYDSEPVWSGISNARLNEIADYVADQYAEFEDVVPRPYGSTLATILNTTALVSDEERAFAQYALGLLVG